MYNIEQSSKFKQIVVLSYSDNSDKAINVQH